MIELIYISMHVVRTEGRWSAVGVRSRDYQIFWDEYIYLPRVLRWRGLRARELPSINHILACTFFHTTFLEIAVMTETIEKIA